MANWEQPWEFVEQNLLIELNLIGEAFRHEVQRLVFLGSSCIYPREAPQPLKEEYLLTGPLEETNRAYAIAKIGGIELCRSLNREYGTDYLSLMPTNLYGPGDNFDLESQPRAAGDDPQVPRGQGGCGGRARPATASAAGVALWGTGSPRREFLYVEDVGRAITFCLQHVHAADVPDGLLNVGCGEDLTIRELAGIVQRVVGYEGPVLWDDSRPDGTPRKLMDVEPHQVARLGARGRPRGRHPPHLRVVPGEPGLTRKEGPAVSADVIVYANVTLGEGCDLQPPCILGKPPRGAGEGELPLIIGDGATIRAFTVIYAGTTIGHRFQTGHGASIREDNIIGDDCSDSAPNPYFKFGNRIGNGLPYPQPIRSRDGHPRQPCLRGAQRRLHRRPASDGVRALQGVQGGGRGRGPGQVSVPAR